VDQFLPEAAFSTIRLLEDLGYRVEYLPEQTCCGQPAFNAGHRKLATRLAELFLTIFRHSEWVVSPSGSCVSMVRNHYRLLPLSTNARSILDVLGGRICELTEFLAKVHTEPERLGPFPHRVTYHDSCHLLRELGIMKEPRRLLSLVEGLELVEMEESDECCGFGGVFSARFRRLSMEMVRSKLEKAERTGAEYAVSCDAGCLLHMRTAAGRTGAGVKPIHIASVLKPLGGRGV